MSDTRNTSDGPDSGTVATGSKQDPATISTDGSGAGNGAAPRPDTEADPSEGPPAEQYRSSPVPVGNEQPERSAPSEGAEPGPPPRPGPDGGAEASANGAAAAGRSGDFFSAADPPTQQVPVISPDRQAVAPTPPGSPDPTRRPGGRPSGSVPPGSGPSGPVPPTQTSAPPAGTVPGPGPDAAAPPPWRRVPDQPDAAAAPVESAGSTALLGEGPTAFMEPRLDASPPDDARDTGWSAVRTVRNRPPRQAALQLRRLDPWSVLKLSLVLAVVLFFIWLVAVGVLYGVLDGMGVWDRLNGTYADLVSGDAAQTGSVLISAGRVFALAAVVGAINSLLFAVAVTLASFVYNVSADLVGGVEVTLSERD